MKHFGRTRLTVLGVAAGILSLAGVFLLFRLVTPADGAGIVPLAPVWRSSGLSVLPSAGREGGLRPNDIVIGVAGQSLEYWALHLTDPFAARPQWRLGQTIPYRIVRDGQEQTVPVTLMTGSFQSIVNHWGELVFGLFFQLVTLFIFVRRSTDVAAQVLLISAASAMSSAIIRALESQIPDLVLSVGTVCVLTAGGMYLLFYTSLVHFALVFPRRRPFLLKHPRAVALVYSVPFVTWLILLLVARPLTNSVLDWFYLWGPLAKIVNLACLVLAAILMVAGYSTTGDVIARQQTKWVVFAAVLTATIIIVFRQLPGVLADWRPLDTNGSWVVALLLPLAIAVAVLRYHLFDIDVIINRTLVYATLTGLVVGIYVLTVSALGSFFHERSSLPTALPATGLIAVIFQPLRERLQRTVNRLMYGERDDPYAVLSRLGQRLQAAIATEAVLPTIVETVSQALKLPYTAIALKTGDEFTVAASHGLPNSEILRLPLVHQGETLGQLIAASRAPGEAFAPADQRLLEDLAHQAGIAAHAVRLTADLQRSRERLVNAREEERRRLRRDLHDGLGPALASLALKLDAARNLMEKDVSAASSLLVDTKAQIQTVIGDLRRLVYNLRPPALDDLGLVPALREFIAHYNGVGGLHISVEAPEVLPPLPAAVEVAVYRIAMEALNNVVRHAKAQSCHIRLSVSDALHLDIVDDGCGIQASRSTGVGLYSMRERAEELGGSCTVVAAVPTGTHVSVWLSIPKG